MLRVTVGPALNQHWVNVSCLLGMKQKNQSRNTRQNKLAVGLKTQDVDIKVGQYWANVNYVCRVLAHPDTTISP